MPPETRLDLTIVVCTHRREELLAAALSSIAEQTRPDGLAVDVLVVDNSDESSAFAVVDAMAATFPMPLRRIAAHPANISVARNAAAKAASATFVAFLDDDERLAEGWLETVAEGLRTLPHDVFFGAVEAVFETPERATPFARHLFSRHLDAPAGLDLFAMGPTKTPGIVLATCNTVFRRATTLTDRIPFDPAFGHAGGEDFELFCRLQRRGRRFGWLPGARALEWVPAGRCDPGYLRRRLFAGGQVFAAALAANTAHPRVTRWWLRLRALVQLAVLASVAPRRLLGGEAARIDFGCRWAAVLGKLSLGGFYPVYREADRPDPPAG